MQKTEDTFISMKTIFSLCEDIASHRYFKLFIIAVIVLAGVVVGIETYELSSPSVRQYSWLLHALDTLILGVFTIEAVIKILAKGRKPLDYFKNPWNIFDFLIVAVCYLAFLLPTMNASAMAVLRLARILRVAKLVTAVPKLQLLVTTLLKSIPSMFYVSILLFLLFYMYGAAGVFFFHSNDPVHFETLHHAMLSLFRVITLEDWTDIMYINMYGCDHAIWGYSSEMGCTQPKGSFIFSGLYFLSFVLIGTMVFLNLFIGVIMTAMHEAETENRRDLMQKEVALTSKEEVELIIGQIDELKESLEVLQVKL